MVSLKQVKEAIRNGKEAEGPVSTYKYAQIPCLDEDIHDEYLLRIEKYKVQRDFFKEDNS
jgi:hypothetical protein